MNTPSVALMEMMQLTQGSQTPSAPSGSDSAGDFQSFLSMLGAQGSTGSSPSIASNSVVTAPSSSTTALPGTVKGQDSIQTLIAKAFQSGQIPNELMQLIMSTLSQNFQQVSASLNQMIVQKGDVGGNAGSAIASQASLINGTNPANALLDMMQMLQGGVMSNPGSPAANALMSNLQTILSELTQGQSSNTVPNSMTAQEQIGNSTLQSELAQLLSTSGNSGSATNSIQTLNQIVAILQKFTPQMEGTTNPMTAENTQIVLGAARLAETMNQGQTVNAQGQSAAPEGQLTKAEDVTAIAQNQLANTQNQVTGAGAESAKVLLPGKMDESSAISLGDAAPQMKTVDNLLDGTLRNIDSNAGPVPVETQNTATMLEAGSTSTMDQLLQRIGLTTSGEMVSVISSTNLGTETTEISKVSDKQASQVPASPSSGDAPAVAVTSNPVTLSQPTTAGTQVTGVHSTVADFIEKLRGNQTVATQDVKSGSMNIQLDPPALGKLNMHVILDGSNVRVQMTASVPDAKAILDQHVAALKNQLAAQGLTVQEFNVSVGQEAPHNNENLGRNGFTSLSSGSNNNGSATEANAFTPVVTRNQTAVDYLA